MWNFRHKQNKAFFLQSLVDSNLGIIASCPSTTGAWYYYSFLLDRRKLLHNFLECVAEMKHITIYRHHIYLTLEWMKITQYFSHKCHVCHGEIYTLLVRELSVKVTPVFTLSLGLLWPLVPSLSDIRKVMKFY
jgi:hypothetical protein